MGLRRHYPGAENGWLHHFCQAIIFCMLDKAEPFVWTKKKVRQRRFKGRRITQL